MNMWRFGTFIGIEVKPKMSNSNDRWYSVKFVHCRTPIRPIRTFRAIANRVGCN